MARREVLDEEPLDIDLEEDTAQMVDLEDEDEDENDEDEDEGGKSSTRKTKSNLTDEDLDRYEKENRKLKDRVEAAEASAKEAADVAAAAVDRLERGGGAANIKQRIAEQKANIEKQVAERRKALKAAFEEGDADKHATLTEELADLKGQERLLAVAAEQAEAQAKRQAAAPPRPKVHPKAQAWVKRNDWFNSNEEARMVAISVGARLERSGVRPDQDEYYEQIDETMRKRYPELFDEEDPPPRKKNDPPPVRGVERGGESGSRKRPSRVKLTPLQVRIARQWNIPPEKMAQEVLKQRQREENR